MESLKEKIAVAEPELRSYISDKLSHDNLYPVSYGGESAVVFEEYLYYAALQRRAEDGLGSSTAYALPEERSWLNKLSDHKGPNVNVDVRHVEDANVVPTNILGPFNAPFAISQVGWVPGIVLYFCMGVIALYTGLILWRLYIRLDSVKYPLKTYADIAERIFGKTARHVCTVLQSLQLVVNVGTIVLSNGQALSQISKGRLCFAVCIVIWALLGMIIGQNRTLKTYGWLANSAVWINLSIIFISMGFVAHSPPNFAAAATSLGVTEGPVITQAFGHLPLFSKVNGIMNMVFAYGGAMIFPEIMAEMRRPMDFWKGMVLAQALIFVAYVLYGAFIYGYQGQFTLPLAYQGVSRYSWQTVGNVLSLITGIIAAGLYGNIGIKVVYINIVENWLHGPRLMTTKGRYLWAVLVLLYWSLAFIIGSAIPQVQTITGLIAAIAIMQFTYTFPVMLRLGYDVITDAMVADEVYVPGKGITGRVDSWREWSRWCRGLFSGRWYFKLANFLMSLGGLTMACLGMWGAGVSIKEVFAISCAATSFGCKGPV